MESPIKGLSIRWRRFFDHLPIDGFDSNKYGLSASFTLFEAWNAAFTSSLAGWHRRTDVDVNGYFPKNVYSVNYTFGVKSRKVLINGSIGSTSDKPFHSGDELIYGGLATYNVLNNPRHSLFLGVFFNSRIQIPGVPVMPLPIALYMYRSKDFVLVLPFPSVFWKINDSFSLELLTDEQFGQKISFKYHINKKEHAVHEEPNRNNIYSCNKKKYTSQN